MTAALPQARLLEQQAEWLSPARAQTLRRVAVARRHSVLDLGAGYGAVTGELLRRSGGRVVALDRALAALEAGDFASAPHLAGDAARLPFPGGSFDLVFCQCALLWMPVEAALDEVGRVLQPGGALVAVEPDYGGLIEQPPSLSTRELWIAGLTRAGADPLIGRKLPGLLEARGFEVRVDLLSELAQTSPARFDFLRDLPLTDAEQAELRRIESEAAGAPGHWASLAHLPFFLITASRRG